MNRELKKRMLNGETVSERLKFIIDKYDLNDIKEILDIGSWHLMQAIELQNLFPEAKVTAFEPVPNSYISCLRHRDEYNKIEIDIVNMAVSDINGKSKFYAVDPIKSSDPNVGASSLLKFKDGLNGSFINRVWIQNEIVVDTTTLDNWCQNNKKNDIDIIWIDVQGAELNVFKGAEKTLENVKVIFTEVGLKPYYEGHSLKNEIDDFLLNRGFIEVEESFELNGFEYEANTIYINKNKFKIWK